MIQRGAFTGKNFFWDYCFIFFRVSAPTDLKRLMRLFTISDSKLVFLKYFLFSKSILKQDLFVLNYVRSKMKSLGNEYFVEIGCADGKFSSNSYLFEKKFRWSGIIIEPGVKWFNDIKINRNCNFDNRFPINSKVASMYYKEISLGKVSQNIFSYLYSDNPKIIDVPTTNSITACSIMDILGENNAPKFIEYLSIDMEGWELEILEEIDFEIYSFGFITVEHNHVHKNRESVLRLLNSFGYRRVHEDLSFTDDWFENAYSK